MAVSCSPRPDSNSRRIAEVVAAAAEAAGATIDRLVLAETPIPMMSFEGYGELQDTVDDLVERMRRADAFIIATPEYHGSMSGPAKNFFDHGYHEFSGKLFAIASATGGSQGTSCLTHMRATIQYCHGWTLPYHVGVPQAEFRSDGMIGNERITQRLERLGRDLVVYGRMLYGQFRSDLADPAEGERSFAGWHARALSE
jgi:FMN reductase